MKKKTIIKLSVTTILAITLTCWVVSRWKAWFGNPPEPVYSPLSAPGRILLTFGNDDALSRNISWQYDSVLTPSHLELTDTLEKDTTIIKAQGEVFQSRSGKAAYYIAKLRNLKPSRYYRYRVCSNQQYSAWYHFQTHNTTSSQTDCSFLYIGDVQDSIHGKTNKFLKEALRQHPQTEFLVCGGDLTERPIDAYWEETFKGLDSIAQSMPILNVTGNHDYLKHPIRKLERRFSLIFSYFLDSMIGENQVYTLKYNNIQIFCLDSNREFFYLWTQRNWLKEQLAQSQAKWKVVVLHHPLHSIKGKNNNLIQKWMFNSLIEEYKVDLVLQGHEHAYGRMTTHTSEGKATTPLYTISHCSPKNYRIYFGEEFEKFGISNKYYQHIQIHGDTLSMKTYDATNGRLYDYLDIVKDSHTVQVFDKGKEIPENLNFTPNPNNKKDMQYMERIHEYKQRCHIH